MGESTIGATGDNKILNLQSLLAASHKYALTRLQLWCEHKLCSCLNVDAVCSILCQANLYNSKQLVDACFCYMHQHFEAVAITEKFGKLAREWPELMVKLQLFMRDLREDRAAPAVNEASLKRKREHA